jgi:hypothetical protein
MPRVTFAALALLLVQGAAYTAYQEPYSCRLQHDEARKCAFAGSSCDRRVVERLTKECLRDGGNP